MTEYETLEEYVKDFGNRSYIRVARKRVVDHDFTSEFVILTRGFYDSKGERRWTKFMTMPFTAEMLDFVKESLTELKKEDEG